MTAAGYLPVLAHLSVKAAAAAIYTLHLQNGNPCPEAPSAQFLC